MHAQHNDPAVFTIKPTKPQENSLKWSNYILLLLSDTDFCWIQSKKVKYVSKD